MRLGRIISRLMLVAGLCLLLSAPSFSQQWPNGRSQNPYGNSEMSSRITEQPVIQYADGNSAILQWRTDSDFNTFARVGVDPNNLNMVVRSSGQGNPHYARLNNQLQPGQTYYFQIFDPSGNALTPVMAFQTPARGAVRDVPAQLASNMAYNGAYGRRDRDWDRDRDRDHDRDRSNGAYDRDRNPNGQYGNDRYGNALPQGDYANRYDRGYAQDQSGATVQIVGTPRVRSNGDRSAVVTWMTNVPASAIVHYGTDPNRLDQRAEAPWGGTSHTVTLNGLMPGTEYFIQVESGQAQGTGTGITSPVVRFRAR